MPKRWRLLKPRRKLNLPGARLVGRMRLCPSMARVANLGGIGRRGHPEIIEAKIEAEIVAGRAARGAMTAVLVAADPKAAMKEEVKAGPAAADPSIISPKLSSRS